MSIRFPQEILDQMISHCDSDSLTCCASSNKSLLGISRTHLYRSITLLARNRGPQREDLKLHRFLSTLQHQSQLLRLTRYLTVDIHTDTTFRQYFLDTLFRVCAEIERLEGLTLLSLSRPMDRPTDLYRLLSFPSLIYFKIYARSWGIPHDDDGNMLQEEYLNQILSCPALCNLTWRMNWFMRFLGVLSSSRRSSNGITARPKLIQFRMDLDTVECSSKDAILELIDLTNLRILELEIRDSNFLRAGCDFIPSLLKCCCSSEHLESLSIAIEMWSEEGITLYNDIPYIFSALQHFHHLKFLDLSLSVSQWAFPPQFILEDPRLLFTIIGSFLAPSIEAATRTASSLLQIHILVDLGYESLYQRVLLKLREFEDGRGGGGGEAETDLSVIFSRKLKTQFPSAAKLDLSAIVTIPTFSE